jgi:MFS family permease
MNSDAKSVLSEAGTEHRWHVTTAMFISYLYDCYDIIILAIAMPVLLKVLNISLSEGGLLASATMAGAALGSIIFGLIAENYGRRGAIILSLVWFGIFTAMVVLVHSWGMWMIMRFLAGVGIGGVWGPCAALIAQHWSAKYRGRAASFVFSSFAAGCIVAALVGRLVLTVDWRYLFLIGSSSIVVAILVYYLVPPESPKLRATTSQAGDKIGIGAIFEGGYAKITLLACAVSFFNMAGFWGVSYWIPTFLTQERGLSLTSMANFSLVMYIGMFIGYQCFGFLSDRIGRRTTMIIAFLSMAFSVSVYILVLNPIFLFWWGIVVGFVLSGIHAVVGAYFSELFPDRMRAYAGGFCFSIGRGCAIIAPYAVGDIGRVYGLQVGLACDCVIFLLGAFVLLFLPETLKKSSIASENHVKGTDLESSCDAAAPLSARNRKQAGTG